MGRQIVYPLRPSRQPSVRRAHKAAVRLTEQGATDNYQSRLLKYIPSETVGAYIALSGMAAAWQVDRREAALWTAFAFCLALTPLYLWRLQLVRRRLQLCVSTLAFAVWVFAIGGPFATLTWYTPPIGGFVLIAFTTTTPLLIPNPRGSRS